MGKSNAVRYALLLASLVSLASRTAVAGFRNQAVGESREAARLPAKPVIGPASGGVEPRVASEGSAFRDVARPGLRDTSRSPASPVFRGQLACSNSLHAPRISSGSAMREAAPRTTDDEVELASTPTPAAAGSSTPDAPSPSAVASPATTVGTSPPREARVRRRGSARPPPLHLEYAQYGVAIAMEFDLDSARACPSKNLALRRTAGAAPSPAIVPAKPCILGSGGGLVIRGGYRSPGPWYVGGAYEFVRMDSSNLYRLGIFQQLRAELRYLPDLGSRVAPYVTTGLGGFAYGNEWGAETGGAIGFAGAGIEAEVSRVALLGLALVYRPAVIAAWTDTADQHRSTALIQFLALELTLELRSEFGRR